MKELTVCGGCFAEWNDVNFQCFWCGWCPDMVESLRDNTSGWETGKILEKRYQLGKVYVRTEDGYTVWRAWDKYMDIRCFLLVAVDENIQWLSKIAWGLSGQPECGIKVLSLRQLEGKYVLVFSMRDSYLPIETFREKICLAEEPPAVLVDSIDYRLQKECQTRVLPENILLGHRYRILGCIGMGGFGIIYLCEDILLQRNVAVKEYFPESWAEREDTYVMVRKSGMLAAYRYGLDSFRQEAKLIAKFIHHRHIATIYDIFRENDTAYLVMEYLSGSSIGKEFLQRDYSPYDPYEMAEIINPLLKTLKEIHKQKIIHGDLSPGNMIRTKDRGVVLIDFGAAKEERHGTRQMSVGAFLKTAYAAPEQYRMAKKGRPEEAGPWTDIYAVGAMMYYFLTGHKPPDALTRSSNGPADLKVPKKYNIKLKRGWMKLIHRCTELDPKKRISSCNTVREEIKRLLTHEKEGR